MSLQGSMTTAISGLTAQSRALGHVSENVANSQTVGFKRVDTNFTSWLTRSTQRQHMPGSVEARPDYTNTIQGTIEQVENPMAMAIAGQGFFSVAQARASAADELRLGAGDAVGLHPLVDDADGSGGRGVAGRSVTTSVTLGRRRLGAGDRPTTTRPPT